MICRPAIPSRVNFRDKFDHLEQPVGPQVDTSDFKISGPGYPG
jgi:hypothetical protein